jgi:hypothetical protein
LWTLHANVGSAAFAYNTRLAARRFDDAREISANGIAKRNMRNNSIAEKRVDAMPRAVEELIGDDELQRLMLFLERSDSGNGYDALHAELFEAMNIGAEI